MSLKLCSVLAMVYKIEPGIECYFAKSGSFLRKSEKCGVCVCVCVCKTTLVHIAYTLCNIPICVYDVYLCKYNKYLQMTYTFTNDVRFINVGLTKFTEKAMASHSSTLAWKIPWTEGPGGLQSMGSLGVGHD